MTTKTVLDLRQFVNAANIGGGDAPHQVVEKLQAAINAALKREPNNVLVPGERKPGEIAGPRNDAQVRDRASEEQVSNPVEDTSDFVMVPREPTVEILHAICDMMFAAEWADEGQTFQERCLADAKDLYRAMLSAAEAKGRKG
jgi:hypothetical protein